MREPKGFDRKIFAAKNGFRSGVNWQINEGKINPVSTTRTIQRGYCFSMTCNWIKLSMQHGINQSAKVMEANEILFASIVQAGYQRLAGTFTGAKDYYARESLVYKQFGLCVVWAREINEFESKLRKLAEGFGTSVPPLYFEVGVPAHSVGFSIAASDDSFYLFNSNWGLYRYSDEDGMTEFVKHMIIYGDGSEESFDKISFTYVKLSI
jgi:hypothetical protein